jgi:hypothetical protein
MSDNVRIVKIPCIECGRVLKIRIENDIVVAGENRISINLPGVICPNCVDSVLEKVADPPGLICVRELSAVMAREIVRDFTFLLPISYSVEFFASLFPESGLKDVTY